jgi:hypothetical protein
MSNAAWECALDFEALSITPGPRHRRNADTHCLKIITERKKLVGLKNDRRSEAEADHWSESLRCLYGEMDQQPEGEAPAGKQPASQRLTALETQRAIDNALRVSLNLRLHDYRCGL